MTNISSPLLAAINGSLANTAHGWAVTDVKEGVPLTNRDVTTTNLVGGGSSSTTYISTTTTQTVTLAAPKLRTAVGSSAPMEMTYMATTLTVGGVSALTDATVTIDGATWHTTDATLNTAVNTLVNAYLTAKDTAVIAAIGAGLAPADPRTIDGAMLTALKTTLADTSAGWMVRSRVQNTSGANKTITVALGSMAVKVLPILSSTPTATIPAAFVYTATLDRFGALLSATIIMNGADWTTTDSALHSTIMSMAAAYVTAQSAALTASIGTT